MSTESQSRNRKWKAAGAAALAVALLAGSGATFARWYAEDTLAAANIATGQLSMTKQQCTTWKDASADKAGVADFDPSNDKMVPGDTIECESTVTPTLVGKNLKAKLNVDASKVVPDGKDFLVVTTSIDGETAGDTASKQAANNVPMKVKVTVYFKEFSDSVNNETKTEAAPPAQNSTWWKGQHQNEAVKLNNLKVSLVQDERN